MNLADMISDHVDTLLREQQRKRDAIILEKLEIATELGGGLIVTQGPTRYDFEGDKVTAHSELSFRLDREALPGTLVFEEVLA